MREPQAPDDRARAVADIALVVEIGRELLELWEAPRDRRLVPSVLPADERKDGRNGAGRAASDHDFDK